MKKTREKETKKIANAWRKGGCLEVQERISVYVQVSEGPERQRVCGTSLTALVGKDSVSMRK